MTFDISLNFRIAAKALRSMSAPLLFRYCSWKSNMHISGASGHQEMTVKPTLWEKEKEEKKGVRIAALSQALPGPTKVILREETHD